jgi:DNA-binding CsgD family transcriptional regulator
VISGGDQRIVGRVPEAVAIADAVDAIDRGAAALVIEGEPGIGKTTLWATGVSLGRTRLYWVLACRAAEAETKLGYASLADLIEPVLDEALAKLPEPQQRALEATILRRDPGTAAVDLRAVGAAALGVVRALAGVAPVLLAVDDLQWLDRPSARVLAFVLRRLDDEPVLFLTTQRRGTRAPLIPEDLLLRERVTRLQVPPLADEHVRRLVATTLGHELPSSTLKRIVGASGGNPMAALELGRAVSGRRATSAVEPLPLPDRLGALVHDRLAALSEDSRRVLAEAAALGHPTVDVVAGTGSAKRRALERAAEAGIVELRGSDVRFVHPLFASALYGGLSSRQRAGLHRRLALRVRDPEERARHLALGTGPDEAVAAAIVEGAELAARRGAPDEASQLAEKAAARTPADRSDARNLRMRLAAEFALASGDPVRARALLEPLVEAMEPGAERASALHMLATAVSRSETLRASPELLEQARAEAGDDVGLRAVIERKLGTFFIFAGDLKRAGRHSREALVLSEQLEPSEVAISLAQLAHVDSMRGRGFRRAYVARALRLFDLDARGPEHHPTLLAAAPLFAAGEYAQARALLEDLRGILADWGNESRVPGVLAMLAVVATETGDYKSAASLGEESAAAGRATHQPSQVAWALLEQARAAAHRGELEAAEKLAGEGRSIVQRAGTNAIGGSRADTFATVLGFIELSRGNPARACEHLAPVLDQLTAQGILGSHHPIRPNLIEALIELGELEQARTVLEPWEQRARRTNISRSLSTSGRCRALLESARSDHARALQAVDEALRHHDQVPMPFERARTLLVKGAIERRVNQRRAARATLQEALAIFERLGTPLWAAKARGELARMGGRSAARTSELTPTEDRVARLVASGRTNREVAAALFMSVKTVEANLSRIYRKLDVRSRTELSARLRSAAEPTPVEGRKA